MLSVIVKFLRREVKESYLQLANLISVDGETKSVENLHEARRVAAREGFTSELRQIHCLLGRSAGLLNFTQFSRGIMEKNTVSTTTFADSARMEDEHD